MKIKNSKFACLASFALSFAAVSMVGCSLRWGVPQWSGSGFIKEEFLEYRKVAVLPFEGDSTGEVSDTFALSFHEKFPQMAMVERKQFLGVFQEQDLYPTQLDEKIRKKIGKVFDTQALILGNVYYPSIFRWLMQVKIIDTETGMVLGRSLVEINYMGAEGVRQGCDFAVQKLAPK